MDTIDKDMILMTKKISQLEDLFSISSLVEQKLQDAEEIMLILLECKNNIEIEQKSSLQDQNGLMKYNDEKA